VAADPRHGAMQPHERAAGDGDIGVLARREVDFRAAPNTCVRLLGDEPAQVGAARARDIERRLMGLAACGNGAAAVHRDAQRILLDVGELEIRAAVDVRGGLLGDEPAEIGAA
jgi:hypothetical protein